MQIYASATDATAATGTLNPFLMITFADLKKYKYYYWCCFPALLVKGWQVDGEWSLMTQFSADHVGPTGQPFTRWLLPVVDSARAVLIS